MAGLGRRVFAAGEVLTAGNVMGYLQDQAVMNFAGTAARGSAIGTAVSEGMVSYLADSNAVEVYDGSAWKQVYPSVANAGEIVQVVNGTYATSNTTSSTSFVSTGLTATITPRSATNKVLIIATNNFAAAGNGCWVSLYRNGLAGTNLGSGSEGFGYLYTSTTSFTHVVSLTHLDSPATTSATSYTYAYRSAAGVQTANYLNAKASITLLEIVA